MSDDGGGTDNPAFSNDEDTASCNNSTSTASAGHSNHHSDSEQQIGKCSDNDGKTLIENGKNGSFVSQHYVEPANASLEPKHFTSETRIELPDDSMVEKTPVKPKQNGVHGNGNNNDVSFLNTTVTSVTNNGESYY